MNKTKIEWCDMTLNPVVGCSFNCNYCYAKKLNNRFKWIDNWHEPKFYPIRLKQLKKKKPQNIFMNSMSDIADWNKNWINVVAYYIEQYPQHNYLFLTKRIDCLFEFEDKFLNLLKNENVWIGMTATNNEQIKKNLHTLNEINLNNKCNTFISIEPLHGEIDYHDFKIDWIIVGAETGNRKDKVIPKKEWVNKLIEMNCYNDIPLFFKNSMLPIVGNFDFFTQLPDELIK